MWSLFHVWTNLHFVGFAAAVVSVVVYLLVRVALACPARHKSLATRQGGLPALVGRLSWRGGTRAPGARVLQAVVS